MLRNKLRNKNMPKKKSNKNIRKLTRVGKRSFAITLPIETVRQFGWRERQKLQLTIHRRSKSITIKDWQKKKAVK
jgi:hypothetical protein